MQPLCRQIITKQTKRYLTTARCPRMYLSNKRRNKKMKKMTDKNLGFALPTGDPSVLPAGAKLERVFDAACFLTEGISVSPDDGTVYFCDITFTPLCKDPSGKYPGAGNIWKLDPKSKHATIFRSPSGMAARTKFNAEGNLITAEGHDFGAPPVRN